MGFEIINKIKKEKNLTNAQIAKMSGITLSTLDKITAGINTNPKLDTLQAICRVLGCTLDDFDDTASSNRQISANELEHIKKYRMLDDYGKDVVDTILEKEYDRVSEKEPAGNKIVPVILDIPESKSLKIANTDSGKSDPELKTISEEMVKRIRNKKEIENL